VDDVNWGSAVLWGFVATVFLTGIMTGSQGIGLTRMSIPYMLGSIFTADRDRARTYGMLFHFLNGWLFAAIYVFAFEAWERAEWWIGASIGLVHALFLLTAGMMLLPGMHPRMAGEQRGPTPTRQLEPPGFFARNYGARTPVGVLVAHLVYGAVLGAFYAL
jgi:hypothetical protein